MRAHAGNRPSRRERRHGVVATVALCLLAVSMPADAATRRHRARPLTVLRAVPPPIAPQPFPPIPPQIPPPIRGLPLTTLQASIIDGETRFLTPGPAQDRCPGQAIVFVFGVVNPLRPTTLGDGAFMCRGDAVAQGYLSP